MIKAGKNQLQNVDNPHQTRAKRVLCVCSAGLLRSPTMANALHQKYGFNTRACGSATSFALIPITEALIAWAEEIIFVDQDCRDYISSDHLKVADEWCADIHTLDIPDDHDWGTDDLKKECLRQYAELATQSRPR